MPSRWSTSGSPTSWPTTTCSGPTLRCIPGWSGPYDLESTFHEPFVLFGYLAGFTSLEFTTGIIILPQRQTALVAKQAAEVDLLTRWPPAPRRGAGVERGGVRGPGQDFSDRGTRVDEQVELLRRLWTEPSVTFHGTHEHVTGRGPGPLTGAAPHPGVVRRRSRRPPTGGRAGSATAGSHRCLPDPSSTRPGPSWNRRRATPGATPLPSAWRAGSAGATRPSTSWPSRSGRWRGAGATHVSVNTMGAGLAAVDDHLRVLGEIARALELAP